MRDNEIESILLRQNLIKPDQLSMAKDEARKKNESLEATIVKLGYYSDDEIASAIAQEADLPFVDLDNYTIDPAVIKILPEKIVRNHDLMPVFIINDSLTMAVANPKDIVALDEARAKASCGIIEIVVSTKSSIRRAIDRYYGTGSDMRSVVSQIKRDDENERVDVDAADQVVSAEEAPIIKLVNLLIRQSVKEKASDIHIEPDEDLVRVRFRVDGLMRKAHTYEKKMQEAIISRIKILSHLDIAEKRLPQDGKLRIRVERKDIDIRVSTFPCSYGENIVMRILDKSHAIIELSQLGIHEGDQVILDKMIKKTHGIMLVTGPTGSGKTTTLYAIINAINSMEKNIVTVEDPIEYNIPLIRQTQVNHRIGLTFASGLRSILRQDPDVILVGEVRDQETAQIAIQAAMTGHLVFATIHTNDSTSAIARLTDMGMEPFLISSSLVGCLAQRLLRVLCAKCKDDYQPDKNERADLGLAEGKKLYKPKGCDICHHTGYRGRIGIYEFFTVDSEMKGLIGKETPADQLRKKAIENNMRTMRDDGLEKVKSGMTSYEELLRVIVQDD